MLPSVKALQNFLDQTSIIWNEQGNSPAINSKAAIELASFSRPESIGTAYSQANTLFEAGADYAMALIKTLTEPGQAIASWACARGILETTALATWLWDYQIDGRERVQRSLAFRHEGLIQQLKLANVSKGFLDKNYIVDRLNEVEKISMELGFEKIGDKKGKRIGIAQKMPSITQIVAQMLNEEANYRLLSAVVHGHNWALQNLSFKIAEENQTIFEGIKGSFLEKHLEYSHVTFLCTEAFVSLSHAILARYKLFGWDAKRMGIIFERTRKHISAE